MKLLNLIIIVVTVLLFKEIIEKTGTATELIKDFERLNIPPMAVITLLPLITGVLTGLVIGSVGASFPLIIPMITFTYDQFLPYFMLAYFFAYIGVLISPVHICMVVTKEHFKTTYFGIMKHSIMSYIVLTLFAFLWFFILKFFSI